MRNFLLATLALTLPATAQQGTWLTDFEAAKATAKKEQKLILADFTGSDWCHWCKKLKQEVFEKSEFKAWAKENVVLLELDFPRRGKQGNELRKQNRELGERFTIQGYPTILFLDAAGKKVGQMGYAKGGATKWIELAKEQMLTDSAAAAEAQWMNDYDETFDEICFLIAFVEPKGVTWIDNAFDV